jgi:hypothetical protein
MDIEEAVQEYLASQRLLQPFTCKGYEIEAIFDRDIL